MECHTGYFKNVIDILFAHKIPILSLNVNDIHLTFICNKKTLNLFSLFITILGVKRKKATLFFSQAALENYLR
jgi:hypothetical protein